MDVKIARANVWGVPVKGTLVNINQADVGAVVSATAGLSRSILGAGAAIGGGIAKAAALTIGTTALGLAGIFVTLMIGATQEERKRQQSKASLDALAWIKTEGRSFYGVCLTPSVNFLCHDGQSLTVPTDSIDSISGSGGSHMRLDLKTVDGGSYWWINQFLTEKIDFLTLAGVQNIRLVDRWGMKKRCTWLGKEVEEFQRLQKVHRFSVERTTFGQALSLRENLGNSLDLNREKIVKTVGEETFRHYFSPIEA